MKFLLVLAILLCIFESIFCIRCYKCRGDDECDFNKRTVYIDNCTWASKCWGARIGRNFIRGCADDRCTIQLGLSSYIESKCCYKDFCNDDRFFMPDSATFSKSHLVLILNSIFIYLYFVFFN